MFTHMTPIRKDQSPAGRAGILTAQSAPAMIAPCDIVLLAVKPNVCASVLRECANALKGKALISIVTAGRGRYCGVSDGLPYP
jgi:pyrroline-5-carboxylate reductase